MVNLCLLRSNTKQVVANSACALLFAFADALPCVARSRDPNMHPLFVFTPYTHDHLYLLSLPSVLDSFGGACYPLQVGVKMGSNSLSSSNTDTHTDTKTPQGRD